MKNFSSPLIPVLIPSHDKYNFTPVVGEGGGVQLSGVSIPYIKKGKMDAMVSSSSLLWGLPFRISLRK